jgi:hypothetical protein
MRFKLEASKNRNGQKKTVKKFALFPKIVDNGKTLVWLESYWVDYRWKVWDSPTLKDEWQVEKIYSKSERIKQIEKTIYGN